MREIISRVEDLLEKSGCGYCISSGCFELAAKKGKNLFILKILRNVDSVQEEHAISLKTMASELGTTALIIGEHTRKEELEDGLIYQRYDIPAINLNTLESFFTQNFRPIVTRNRGGLFVEINSELLRKKRQKLGLTQGQLAEKVGTTKKSIYEHERENKRASKDLTDRLEAVLGDVSAPCIFNPKEFRQDSRIGEFEKRISSQLKTIGFDAHCIGYAPFNIIAKNDEMTILSEAEENKKRLEKNLEEIIGFSHLSKKPVIAITSEKTELEIPTVAEKDLRKYSVKDLKHLAKHY